MAQPARPMPVSVVLIVLELGTRAFELVPIASGSVSAPTPVSDLSLRPSYFSF